MPIPQAANHVLLGVVGSFGKNKGRMDGDHPVTDWDRVYDTSSYDIFLFLRY